MDYLISLVIPTNGISEWVIPVLDSIYSQSISENLFEVIVVNNGDNTVFENLMLKYSEKHNNLIYKKTDADLFLNQIEGFKLARGSFIKFINHRTILVQGALQYLIDFVEKNESRHPITYFLNDTSEILIPNKITSEFDSFVYGLGKYSSWSGGVSCWREDLHEILTKSTINNNDLFPHLIFVFFYKEDRDYLIDNTHLVQEIPTEYAKKGKYDIFYAFGVQFVDAINKLENQNMIFISTKEHILNENKKFLIYLYSTFVILRKPCSYDLSSSRTSLNYFYDYKMIRRASFKRLVNRLKSRIRGKLIGK
ncbi:TPA: glycosyltransferase [Streptococcus suis]